MKHIEIETSDFQRANFEKLAAYLKTGKTDLEFDMTEFNNGDDDGYNTSQGAAARIEYMLKNGIPENYNDQILGKASLCYKVQS
jgi:hypothetical protein